MSGPPEPARVVVLDGVEAPDAYGELAHEVRAIRQRVALSVHPHLAVFRFEGGDAVDDLAARVPTDLALRDGQFCQALLLHGDGRPRADLLVGFVRGDLVVIGSGLPADELAEALGAESAQALHTSHTVIGVDGPFAWELMAAWDSPGIIGLPYLGAFTTGATDGEAGAIVIRGGRTGEYGYLVIVPNEAANATWGALAAAGATLDVATVGQAALRHCALENWVFDIHREGPSGLDAMELQLTWRVDFTKGDELPGLSALRAHREQGLRRRITAMVCDQEVAVGSEVACEGARIGQVIAAAPDLFGGPWRALAVLDMAWAQSGVSTYTIAGHAARTVSAPWVLNRSLFVDPQKHGYALRDEIPLPDGVS